MAVWPRHKSFPIPSTNISSTPNPGKCIKGPLRIEVEGKNKKGRRKGSDEGKHAFTVRMMMPYIGFFSLALSSSALYLTLNTVADARLQVPAEKRKSGTRTLNGD